MARYMLKKASLPVILFTIGLTVLVCSSEERVRNAVNRDGKRPMPVVAIDSVCAWPNLTVLKDGTIAAVIHNEPSHLRNPSDVDCWASTDGGQTWEKRGTPGPRDNATAMRGNVAAGLAANGDLVVICSGWSDSEGETRGVLLPLLVSRSTDGGTTWDVDPKGFPGGWTQTTRSETSPEGFAVPFGDIVQGNDGTLRAGMYTGTPGETFVYRSRDDGRTWVEPVVISPDTIVYEPALFHLGKGNWLCAARNSDLDTEHGMDLYRSEDDARTWTFQGGLTPVKRFPGHFLRLRDGRILLTYGNRLQPGGSESPRGVEVMVSDDEGRTWNKPVRLCDFYRDGGYPSSVQLPDGQVLTAYYARKIEGHDRYHMGTVIWDPDRTLK